MKFLVAALFLAFSSNSLSFECGEIDKYEKDFVHNYKLAKNVFFGRVVLGELVESYRVEFEMDVNYVVKGNLKNRVSLATGSSFHYGKVVVGGNYLVLLYEDQEVDACAPFIETEVEITSKDDLIEYSNRKDWHLASLFQNLLKQLP